MQPSNELILSKHHYPIRLVDHALNITSIKPESRTQNHNCDIRLIFKDTNQKNQFGNLLIELIRRHIQLRSNEAHNKEDLNQQEKNQQENQSGQTPKIILDYKISSTDEIILPYQTQILNSGRTLISGYLGKWAILAPDEIKELSTRNVATNTNTSNIALSKKLEESFIRITPQNIKDAILHVRRSRQNLLMRPSLHIINTTNICNYRCIYCHAGASIGEKKMTVQTAIETIKYIMTNSGHALTIEFQGGESATNWDAVSAAIDEAWRINDRAKKDLRMTVVTNLSLMDEARIRYLCEKNVSICTSLDGPKIIHDKNRRLANGNGTYNETIKKIEIIREIMGTLGKPTQIGALCTMTRHSLSGVQTIVDEYVRNEIKAIHLRPLNNMGDATTNWKEINYSAEEYCHAWTSAMDYILSLNKNGKKIIERGALIILLKIIDGSDPCYTEQMSPCGAGRAEVLYNYDGSIYTCDEARTISDDLFKIGNINIEAAATFSNEELINTWLSSNIDLTCYHCAYRPWCGTCPVMNYRTRNNLVPNITENFMHKVFFHQFTYLFNKIDSDPESTQIFKKWIHDGTW